MPSSSPHAGTYSVLIECVKMVVRTGARSTAVSRMTLAAMASGPVALSTLMFSGSFSTPASVMKGSIFHGLLGAGSFVRNGSRVFLGEY